MSNSAFVIISAFINGCALCTHLNAWPSRSNLFGQGLKRNSESPEKLGFVVFLFVIIANLCYLILAKVPLLHQDWHASRFLFGDTICQQTLIVTVMLGGTMQFYLICLYLASLWLRLRKVRSSYESQTNVNLCKEGLVILILASSLSLSLGFVLTYRLNWKLEHSCYSSWRTSPWLTTFRWLWGYFGPLGILALPSIFKLLSLKREIKDRLRPFVVLSGLFVTAFSLLQFPALAVDTEVWITQEDSRSRNVAHAFVIYILTGILPELHLVFVPMGMWVLLPNGSIPRGCQCLARCCFCCCTNACTQQTSIQSVEDLNGHTYEERFLSIDTATLNQRLSRSQTTVV